MKAVLGSLKQRVGFWRAMFDVLLSAVLLWIAVALLSRVTPAPGAEILSFTGFGLYIWAAWRLERSTGPLWRRATRVLLWTILLGALGGVLGWAVNLLVPIERRFMGIEPRELVYPFSITVLTYTLTTLAVFVPLRGVLSLWRAGRERLRWQLTASYVLVGLLTTLLLPFAFALYTAVISLALDPPLGSPTKAAEQAAAALGPLVLSGDHEALQISLAGLLDGTTRLPDGGSLSGELDTDSDLFGDLRRVSVVAADGSLLAYAVAPRFADDAGPPQAAQYRLLLAQAVQGQCASGYPAGGTLADVTVCPVAGRNGQVLAAVVAEVDISSSLQVGAAFGRTISFVLLSASLSLNLLPLVASAVLPVALLVGYVLARRLTRRVERLTAATSHLAAGEYSRRVPVDSHDEIGRLSDDFNAMAARLEEREQALRAETERSEQLLQANRRLTADVSHELRTPLTTLRGYVEALSYDYGDRLPAGDLRVIEAELERLQALIDDLFTLARTEARQLPLEIEQVDAADIALRLAQTLAPLARRERQIELITELPVELPPVLADRSRLEQVLLNLLQNALRHTPAGGIVALRAASSDARVLVTVADTGVGIPQHDLPHVFERFFRGDSSRARETGGAGLGLALVLELITAMGGEVSAESTPGRGSAFTIALPVAPKGELATHRRAGAKALM